MSNSIINKCSTYMEGYNLIQRWLANAPSNLEKITAYFSRLLCHAKGFPEKPKSMRFLELIKLLKLLYLLVLPLLKDLVSSRRIIHLNLLELTKVWNPFLE